MPPRLRRARLRTLLATLALDALLAATVPVAIGAVRNGNRFANTLTGTDKKDILRGRGSRDTLRGLGGNDLLSGGNASDTFYVGADRRLRTGERPCDPVALRGRDDPRWRRRGLPRGRRRL